MGYEGTTLTSLAPFIPKRKFRPTALDLQRGPSTTNPRDSASPMCTMTHCCNAYESFFLSFQPVPRCQFGQCKGNATNPPIYSSMKRPAQAGRPKRAVNRKCRSLGTKRVMFMLWQPSIGCPRPLGSQQRRIFRCFKPVASTSYMRRHHTCVLQHTFQGPNMTTSVPCKAMTLHCTGSTVSHFSFSETPALVAP